jgi:hypothetical protein
MKQEISHESLKMGQNDTFYNQASSSGKNRNLIMAISKKIPDKI